MSSLHNVIARAHSKGRSEGSWQACHALATMALSNLIGKEVNDDITLADHGLCGLTVEQFSRIVRAVPSPDAMQSVVRFLEHAMRNEKVHGILLRVYDVVFPLSQIAMNTKNHPALLGAGLVELGVEIVQTWRPGLYCAQFSAERANTYPVLEYASEILEHLTRHSPARKLMIELDLERTCERLIREHVEIVQRHAAKVLWRLRDRESILAALEGVIDGVDMMKSMGALYNWTDPERNMRIKGLVNESGFDTTLHESLQWLHTISIATS